MEIFRRELTGWKAAALLAVVLALGLYRYLSVTATIPTEAVEVLKSHLRAEYTRLHLDGLDPASLRRGSLPSPLAEAKVRGLLAVDEVEIASIRARGTNPFVARVEVRVAGGPPPDGRPVRYFRLRHAALAGWRVGTETSALAYHLRLF